jgi:L-amino acid N-acyltransferase YncA
VRDIQIRQATDADFNAMWTIFQAHVAQGETFVHGPSASREESHEYWFAPKASTFVANASYMVSPNAQGVGLGRMLGEHSILEARRRRYLAMQFDYVVSTNDAAINLWKRLGFSIVGTLPKAYRHRRLGYVDAYVMYKLLEDPARWQLPEEG